MLRPMRVKSSPLIALLAAPLLTACGQVPPQLLTSEDQSGAVRGGPSCEERSLDAPPDSAIDWANYLRRQDRVYTAKYTTDAAAVVPDTVLGTVTCTRSNSRTPVNHIIRDGEAAFLEVGTAFHSIPGRSTDDAITAVFKDQRLVFEFDKMFTEQLLEAQRPADDVLQIASSNISGAVVCKADTSVDLPDKQCRQLDQDAGRRIAEALNGAPPHGAGSDCLGDAAVYKVVLADRTLKTVPIILSTACGPVSVGTRRYRISNEIVQVVTQEHDRAS